jgi:putative heme-binding domain-containing protein
MGMLFVDNVLYLNGHGSHGFALYRCKDTKGDESYDDVEFLREWHGGAGEHGAHALVLGPDKKLYAVCGNFTAIPKDLAPSSPHRVYADDLALKRMEDGNGFGAGNPPPGGYVARMDLDGGNAELFASGERNTYDIAFNADGELFGFDSDMEWDWGSPWYRPIRVFHAVRGGDQGFREGSGKWPEYYPDSLPAAVTIGIGCPTGVGFGTGARFPAKYQKALFICDWTYGRLIAVHLEPKGATYGGSWEDFVAPKSLHTKQRKTPLNLTDALIGDDGAMYFTTGGRGTVADLFRVTYTGSEPATPIPATQQHDGDGAAARELRHQLEAFNVKPDPAAVGFAWPHLGNPDRFIRYAARLAIERNPVAEWQAKALAEQRPDAALTALLALARLGGADAQPAIVKAVTAFPPATLTAEQLLDAVRVIEVSIARQGVPTGDVAKAVIAYADPLYPAKTEFLNRELCQVLLALDAPNAVARTVALLEAAPTQEEQLTYVVDLRSVKSGWTTELRRKYLSWWESGRSSRHPDAVVQWFTDAGIGFNNGSSFKNLLSHALKDAKASMSPEEFAALGDVARQPQATAQAPAAARAFVKDWKTADLQPLLDQVSKGRDFARGKAAFASAQCIACHRYGDQGGAVGPDLTAVATRFKRQDILESITEPSKVISEQYMNSIITMNDGSVIVGRVVQETEKTVTVAQNPFVQVTTSIAKSDIKSRGLSKVSIMPPGLLNTFTKEEILDLLAFLESMGDPGHPDFGK